MSKALSHKLLGMLYIFSSVALSSLFNVRSPDGQYLLTKNTKGMKIWTAEVCQPKLNCHRHKLTCCRMVFARKLLNGTNKLKPLLGAITTTVSCSTLCLDLRCSLTATEFLSVEGSKVYQLVSLFISSSDNFVADLYYTGHHRRGN